jgi:hypothetical protein
MNTLLNIQSTIISSLIYGIAFLISLIVVIFIGNLILEGVEKFKKPGKQNKSLKDIIHEECKEIRQKKINLSVFANEVYCVANNLRLYLRNGKETREPEYIIMLETDKGNLVELGLDYFHANDEFIFICEEDEVGKDGANIAIHIFSYKLFDKNLEKEINIPKKILIHEEAA